MSGRVDDLSVEALRGVGEKKSKALALQGIRSVGIFTGIFRVDTSTEVASVVLLDCVRVTRLPYVVL